MILPNELIIFFSAMAPVMELSGSIPLGITVLKMDPWTVYFISVTGNALMTGILISIMDPATKFLMRHSKFLKHIIEKIFRVTRQKHEQKMAVFGHWALYGLLSLPIPVIGLGGWSGALIVHLFGIKKLQGWLIVIAGMATCGVFFTLGVESIFNLF